MGPFVSFLSIAVMLFCTSCNEEKSMPECIRDAGVVIVELTDIDDPSSLTSPKAKSYYITNTNVAVKISSILSSHREHLHSGLISATLPFGFINIFDEDGERLLVFKLDRILSDNIKVVMNDSNMGGIPEESLLLTKIPSRAFVVIPKKHPLAMSYKISRKEFEYVVGIYRENVRK